MSQRQLKNIPASVRARLLNEARLSGVPYDQVLQYFAIERFLYRLSSTGWGERLIVKGAIMLRAWGTPLGRPTRDIDFLGTVDNSLEAVAETIRECLKVECPADGLVFDRDFEVSTINMHRQYPGVRVVLRGSLDGGVFKLQLDIGVDDATVPSPAWVNYPTILDMDAPRILAYQPLTALAEKFETIACKGVANSRLKDYYDIWLLSQCQGFSGAELSRAISATFRHRGTVLTIEVPSGLTKTFYESANAQAKWRSLLQNTQVEAPPDLSEICDAIVAFMMPPVIAAATSSAFSLTWEPTSGWS